LSLKSGFTLGGFDLHWRGANLMIALTMLAYAGASALAAHLSGHPENFETQHYLGKTVALYILLVPWIPMMLFFRATIAIAKRVLLGIDAPIAWCFEGLTMKSAFTRILQVSPVLVAWPFLMSGFTGLKRTLNSTLPFSWDDALLEIDTKLHFGKPLWQWVATDSTLFTDAVQVVYFSWTMLLIAIPLMITLLHPACFRRTQYLVSHILILFLLGNVVAGLFMSGGPFLAELTDPSTSPYTALFDHLKATNLSDGYSAIGYQKMLFSAYSNHVIALGSGISAFPSIHVAIATLWALFAWRLGRLARAASLAFLSIIMLGSVQLGWHYSVDGYFSIAASALIYFGVGKVLRFMAKAPQVASSVVTA
jgi:hypothetical protein